MLARVNGTEAGQIVEIILYLRDDRWLRYRIYATGDVILAKPKRNPTRRPSATLGQINWMVSSAFYSVRVE
jgi:hypothetical protein